MSKEEKEEKKEREKRKREKRRKEKVSTEGHALCLHLMAARVPKHYIILFIYLFIYFT